MAGSSGLFTIIIMIGIFYFFLIRPEQTKQKKVKAMMNSLSIGDVVFTRGGIHGTIVALDDDVVTIATGPDKVKINVSRQGIGSVIESAPVQSEAEAEAEVVAEAQNEVKSEISLDKKNEEIE